MDPEPPPPSIKMDDNHGDDDGTPPAAQKSLTLPEPSAQPSTTTEPVETVSKVGKKKFKKLKKRSLHVDTNGPTSGLLTKQEWIEYQSLSSVQQQPVIECVREAAATTDTAPPTESEAAAKIGPLIQLRNSARRIGTRISSEGVHHRDLLSYLLLLRHDEDVPTSKSKKRKHGDGNGDVDEQTKPRPFHPMDSAASIPHWASCHNPGTVQHLVVLEIHTTKHILDKYVSMDHEPSLAIPTKWFQGSIPKSMTDSLMYFSKSGDKQQKKKKSAEIKRILNDPDSIPSLPKLVELLRPLVLSMEELVEEGYPLPPISSLLSHETATSSSSTSDVNAKKPEVDLTEKIDPLIAKEFVTTAGVRVEEQDTDDSQPYVSTNAASSSSLAAGYASASASSSGISPRIFGVDCEMVITNIGLELARVTVLQLHGIETKTAALGKEGTEVKDGEYSKSKSERVIMKTKTIIDCLVRPQGTITDYLTQHSGITPQMLEDVTTNISQVQYFLAHLINPDDILVGHSLENDLKALHLIHETCVDTSMMYRASQRRHKISLRHLSSTILKREIQTGNDGHCSEEDALAALELAILKAWLGDLIEIPGYGGEKDRRRSLLQHPAACSKIDDENPNSAAFVGPSSWIQEHVTSNPNNAHALPYESVESCIKAIKAWISNSSGRVKPSLVWGNLSMLNNDSSVEDGTDEKVDSGADAIDGLVNDITTTLPPATALMVALQADFQKSVERNRQRQACQDARSAVGWSIEEEEEEWQALLDTARNGCVVWIAANDKQQQ